MNARDQLDIYLNQKEAISQKQAFEYFDQLEGVDLSFMFGRWRGRELKSNHPREGMLELVNWYGKEFIDSETVYPLIFKEKNRESFYGNPGLMPLNQQIDQWPQSLIKFLFQLMKPIIKTSSSKARLRMMEYRGKYSATMIYDQVAIYDIFRKVDDHTVLGVMDFKGQYNEMGYFFILEREQA